MDKLISSEKLIHDLSGIRDTLPDIFLKNVMSAAISCVEKQHTVEVAALRDQEERRWIPVTERFPNTGAVVLTFSNKDGVNIGKYVGYGAFVVRKWDINSKPSRTTHWMPMPEPPKGE